MVEYTKKYARFVKLDKAKQDLLQPLLRDFKHMPGPPIIEEVGTDEQKVPCVGTEKKKRDDSLQGQVEGRVLTVKVKVD